MKTETIEWFTPEEKLPENNKDVICITKWGFDQGYYSTEHMEWCGGVMDSTPMLWAYAPKGPQ